VFSALSMVDSVRAGLTPLRPWREALAEAVAVPIQQ
jgi:dTDP-4-dehydrorhamnose reductase